MIHLLHRIMLALLVMGSAGIAAGGQGLNPLPDRPQASDFTLLDVDGNSHRLSDYRGKVMIVNFWATWCPPCREEMPSLQRAWDQVRDEGIVVLAIDVGENREAVSAFLGRVPMDFPFLLDERADVTTRWPVKGLPTTFVLDTKGRFAYHAIGEREWDDPELLAPVRSLLEEPADD